MVGISDAAGIPAGARGRGAVVGWYKSLLPFRCLTEHTVEGRFVDDFDTELTRLLELRARARTRDDEVRLRADRTGHLRAERFRERFSVLARTALERACEHDGLARECAACGRGLRGGWDDFDAGR